MNRQLSYLFILILIISLSTGCQWSADESETVAKPAPVLQLPHIEINQKEKYIDLVGQVCFREGLTELAVTVRGGKPHESPFLINARPQHVNFALLSIGLKSGNPADWSYDSKTRKSTPIDPQGDLVKVTVLYKAPDGQIVEQGVSQFIKDNATGKVLPHDYFIFGGSRIRKLPDNRTIFEADDSGDVISVVAFGDEVLSWPRPSLHSNADVFLVANTEKIPPLQTPVTIRIRPADVRLNDLRPGMDAWYRAQAKRVAEIRKEFEAKEKAEQEKEQEEN